MSAEVPRVSLDLNSQINNWVCWFTWEDGFLLQELNSCSELFGAMKDEGSLHWCGNAAGNEIDRNKNHMLISHSTELQVKQVFPHPM